MSLSTYLQSSEHDKADKKKILCKYFIVETFPFPVFLTRSYPKKSAQSTQLSFTATNNKHNRNLSRTKTRILNIWKLIF